MSLSLQITGSESLHFTVSVTPGTWQLDVIKSAWIQPAVDSLE